MPDIPEAVTIAPFLVAALIFLLQNKIVVTPAQLEKKHREILEDVSDRFVTKDTYNDLRCDFTYIKEKIDKIYEMMRVS